ncbi:MAG: hypothetical protein EZS28_043563 [Streblomastix strix]|uniref:KilA-N domain-containing protein n=1 Tax=Streblomastix strix TaxID=222440 RepID=A0A5J4TSF2_9EUKA|nr:MAG: hypothetical protein EZS28_043563 [Streblomastix strix]
MTQVETATVIQNNEQFVCASYNGMTILVRQSDGYINVTQFCQQYSKQFRSLIKQDRWKDYIKAEIDEGQPERNLSGPLMYSIDKGFANDFKGYYVHPILINYIAIWISPKYAVNIRKKMDSINENSQQTHTNFEANVNRIIEQLQRENTDYSNIIQHMEPITINHVTKDVLNERGIKMKKLSFTIPNEQDDTEIMDLIRQTVTQRSIH